MLLLDPYAKAVDGQIDGDESLFSYRFDARDDLNDMDSRGHAMLSVVTDTAFDWGDDRAPDLAITEPDREGDPVTVDTFQDGETGQEVHAEDSVHIEARSTLVLIRP